LGIIRFVITIVVVFAYGVVGFWLLDTREFGINFTIADAIEQTIRFVTIQGDPAIIPKTRHARWFLDSLSMITAVACCYGLFALFRPVRYRYLTLPHEREQARIIAEQYGRHSLDYFKLWPDKSYFFCPSRTAFLAYRVGADFAVVLGDPVGPEGEIEGIIRGFMAMCRENDWGLAFHQTLPDFIGCYERLGFKKLKIGDDAIVDLTAFSLEGKAGKALRHEVNKLEQSGVHTVYHAPPLPADIVQQAKAVSDDWLRIEGRRERRFTLGLFDPEYVRSTPLCAVVDARGKMQAFANIIRSYHQGEATIDLMRRRSDAPYGVMDYLFVKLFVQCKEKGYATFSLGMAPMSGFQDHENPSREERAIHYFFQHMNFLFSYRGLRFYKAKFASRWEPRYVVYQNAIDLARHAVAIGVVSRL
jgi:phosphatidylglycerol lysyltransferase